MEDAIEGAGKSGRKKQNADLRIHGAEDDYVSSEDEFKRDRTKKARGKKNIGGKQGANDEVYLFQDIKRVKLIKNRHLKTQMTAMKRVKNMNTCQMIRTISMLSHKMPKTRKN